MKTNLAHDFLGWFAENNKDLLFSLAKLETRLIEKHLSRTMVDRPIYICGLARSGTSILLELISQCSGVASYRYMDFPFAMLPYWWGKFIKMNSKKGHIPAERYHSDGLYVTPESPEAMEEIIWMYFFKESHDPALINTLDCSQESVDFNIFYTQTIRKLLFSRSANRYLAKNNYNISRFKYLKNLFNDARFILLIRDPVWHIASLIKQHNLISEGEIRDKKILAHMRRLGHFEFGLDRRPLNLSSNDNISDIQRLWQEGDSVRGWARYWRGVHAYLVELLGTDKDIAEAILIVNYDELCNNSKDALTNIYSHVGLEPSANLLEQQARQLHPPLYYEPNFNKSDLSAIHSETDDIYKQISSVCRQ